MIPPRYRPPLPMRFWRGKNTYEIRMSPCGRYIGSKNGQDVAISADPAVLMRILLRGPDGYTCDLDAALIKGLKD